MDPNKFEYRLAAFNHPAQTRSVKFLSGRTEEKLLKDIVKSLDAGANLFSIRIFREAKS